MLVVKISKENKSAFALIIIVNKLGVIAVNGNNQFGFNYWDCIVAKQWKEDKQERVYFVGENARERFKLFFNIYTSQ